MDLSDEINTICSDFSTNGNSLLLPNYLDKIRWTKPDPNIFETVLKVENASVITVLLQAKSDPNQLLPKSKIYPIYFAIQYMNSDILQSLLEYKANPNQRNESGCHILMDMLYPFPTDTNENSIKKFKIMLDAGANINMPSEISNVYNGPSIFSMGMGMLHEDDEILHLMVTKFPNVNVLYSDNTSILEEVINTGNILKTKILLSLGAQVSVDLFKKTQVLSVISESSTPQYYEDINYINHFEKILQFLRMAIMMDKMHVSRDNFCSTLPCLQFICITQLSTSTEYDIRLELSDNDTPYKIHNDFYFPLESNPIKESEHDYAIAINESLDTQFISDILYAINL